MTCIKLTNINFNGRNNQNTTIVIMDRDYGFTKDNLPTERWVIDNLETLKNGVKKQANTKIKIIWSSYITG